MNGQSNLLFIGEAMLELVPAANNSLLKSFAGDVYNTSVYLKRSFPTNNVHFMTAVGSDPISNEFLERVSSEGIQTNQITRSQNKHMGAYMVLNDSTGERSFIYWRNDSAAKSMMSECKKAGLDNLTQAHQAIFFSGITLAILRDEEREALWKFIASAKEQGSLIIFDPNYRPALWGDAEAAKQQFEMAYKVSDWLLPGLDDFNSLYGLDSIEACIDFCRPYQFKELVIKQGEDPVHVVNEAGEHVYEILSSTNVVDTTSAGDAFNGIYIGARLAGRDVKQSVQMANYAAIKVIESPGAIMPKSSFLEAIKDW